MLFKPKDAPTYAPGFIAVLATSTAAALLAILYRFICIRENCRRDKNDTQECADGALDDVGDRKKRHFTYIF
jgi:hypothetical protein